MSDSPELAEIRRIIRTELRSLTHHVEATPAWTKEGKRARAALKDALRRINDLAVQSNCQQVIDMMERIRLPVFGVIERAEELPNWDDGGSLN